ncbi:hypothetical protein [Streptomyces sp. NPDC088360]|uniref:hypothetical protein n=1 Tax=Streptomyces sp. NPDC088360 TaxID=3154515 RepID=UPI00344CFB3C
MTTSSPSFKPGDVRTRADIREELGGSPQGGICPSREKETVVLYSDITSGEKYGYRDGWLREEDRLGPVYEYTGAGTQGDQTFAGVRGTGNAAILQHAEDGRTIHLFIAEGKVPGGGTKTHRYIGAFAVDEDRPYTVRRALDEDRIERDVIVFRLRPIGLFHRSESDVIPPAPETKVTFVQAEASRRVRPPKLRKATKERNASAATNVARARDELTAAYASVLGEEHHIVGRIEVQARDIEDTLVADLFDQTQNTIFEPSASSSRQATKDAFMQLLEISRYVESTESRPLRRMVLLPALPSADLCDLLAEHNVGIIYRDTSGGFSEFQSSRPGPVPTGSSSFPCTGCPALTG